MSDDERPRPGETLAGLRAEIDRLRAGQASNEARLADLEDAVAARDAFIAIAGHELRNPMGTIVVSVTHILHLVRKAPEQYPAWLLPRLLTLEKHTRLFVRRATTLLDVSRINVGQVRLDLDVVDFSLLLQEGVDALATDIERAGTALTLSIESDVGGFWDRTAVEQVVHNLVSNALKYGAQKPVYVSLTADADQAIFRVEDHGVGISDQDRHRIFQRFERVISDRMQGGFGLGLWITHQLVSALGGTIEVSSRPGEGSTFTVTLPRALERSTS